MLRKFIGWILLIIGIIIVIFSAFGCDVFICISNSCQLGNYKCFILFYGFGLLVGIIGFVLNINKEYKKKWKF